MSDNFFVISCFGEGELEQLISYAGKNHHLYKKGPSYSQENDDSRITHIDNVGYNLYSYMKFIIDNYDALPEFTVFCKNNVFPRHVSQDVFIEQSSRKVFTCIEDPSRWKLKYPGTMLSSDNGFMELNTSWYTDHHPTKYFSNFNEFYKFAFDYDSLPRYLRFAPGGNYVVPRESILLRSKSFYQNLMNFVSHHQFSGESHIVERALYIIWNSTIQESKQMSTLLDDNELLNLERNSQKNSNFIRKVKIKIYINIISLVNLLTGSLFN
jgi:hypothetical protein